ncbi:UV DNA damage repair endonuclease UvsE [Aquibacillus koreensis]|uniref:UV DNA damage repair endonuclease UvsE n=1 Tax=Aquibacillus koreensis TaxID=279446 RepID=A0A9X3WRZ7_9BACI|nr:UV DNA damage repair endonuclease UvsE [Aquibacillus koreensis]MCT2535434.1 UV DNA damage repair endonuclease UvsE [Aquibacillus koreensis]MDC3422269.1 UV DNA damage repair endonuclease UvsE [Aquibacillus koreensis]
MIIRFGYVSTALSLWEASPSRTMTYTNWKKQEQESRKEKLHHLTEQNLKNTIRILHYNIAHGIDVYRMSSSLVPLATHPDVNWDYRTPFLQLFEEIGSLVKRYNLRVSFHPNQFTLFTSPQEHVTDNAIIDMTYHYHMLEAMGLHKDANINIHVGGSYGNKQEAITRFDQNFVKLDEKIRMQTTLENDDKTYTTEETLQVCEKHHIPFVFDYHHHWANPGDEQFETLLPRIFATWKRTGKQPKFHLSSPKSDKLIRAHADYVDVDFALPFIKALKAYGESADIMIEAKAKDKAALNLVEELAKVRTFKRINGGAIEI